MFTFSYFEKSVIDKRTMLEIKITLLTAYLLTNCNCFIIKSTLVFYILENMARIDGWIDGWTRRMDRRMDRPSYRSIRSYRDASGI